MKDAKKRLFVCVGRKLTAVFVALSVSALCPFPAQSAAATQNQTAAASTSGWKQNGTVWNWYRADGTMLTDGVTPDGYYVNEKGAWYSSQQVFQNERFNIPDRFLTSSGVESMKDFLSAINRTNQKVQGVLAGKRIFHVYTSGVTYSCLENKTETLLLSLYKDTSCDGWTIRVSCNMKDKESNGKAASVDYGVLRIFAGRFSHTPDAIADAIYESWQGSNRWNISTTEDVKVGDALIRCSVENGAAIYQIQRRKDGDV